MGAYLSSARQPRTGQRRVDGSWNRSSFATCDEQSKALQKQSDGARESFPNEQLLHHLLKLSEDDGDGELYAKEAQTILDEGLRLSVVNSNYAIARILRARGANKTAMSAEEAKRHFLGSSALEKYPEITEQLDAETISDLFLPESLHNVIMWYTEGMLDHLLFRSKSWQSWTMLPCVLTGCAKALGTTELESAFMYIMEWDVAARWYGYDLTKSYQSASMYERRFVSQIKKRFVDAMLKAGADVNVENGRAFVLASELPLHGDVLELLLAQKDKIRPKTRGFLRSFENVVCSRANPAENNYIAHHASVHTARIERLIHMYLDVISGPAVPDNEHSTTTAIAKKC